MTKRALVTGASEGIGRAFCIQLAKEGYAVTAVARNTDRLKELLGELAGSGHRILAADLGTQEGVAATVRALGEGHCDLLINNAGYGLVGDFASVPVDKHLTMIDVNVSAVVALAHAFLGQAKEGDALVNVASVLGILPLPAQAVYSATKAFVVSLSESLWYACKERGVYVMGLCPGSTETKFGERAGVEGQKRPPKNLVQTAEQVVETALAALKRRSEPVVVSGTPNRLFAASSRLMPRRAILDIMGRQM